VTPRLAEPPPQHNHPRSSRIAKRLNDEVRDVAPRPARSFTFPDPTAQFASDPMPTFWDMQPAGLWPTQPSIPPIYPEQGSGWAPSTAAPGNRPHPRRIISGPHRSRRGGRGMTIATGRCWRTPGAHPISSDGHSGRRTHRGRPGCPPRRRLSFHRSIARWRPRRVRPRPTARWMPTWRLRKRRARRRPLA
jgi:hypothetical protein